MVSADGRVQFILQPPLGVQFDVPELPFVETEAKLDTFSSSLELLHAGHCNSLFSDELFTIFSNSFPHSRQVNSNIGIYLSLLFRAFISLAQQ